jgi:hypothetical protein
MAKKNQQAKKMATAGKSAAQIKAKTGVGSQTAQKYVAKQAPAPAPKPAPKPASNSSSNSSRSTPEIKGLAQGIRLAGKNNISKSDYKTIAETTGKSDEKIIGKLDKINTKLEDKGKAGIGLTSGASNMLIKKAQESPPKYRGFGADSKNILFGEGAIGSTLQSMIPRPGTPGIWRQGQLINGREDDPGFNPGGSPDKNRMIGGTVIRPTGKIANKEVGEQYELPKRFKAPKEEGPYDGMEIGPPDLKGPGPLANPNTETWLGNQNPDDETIEPIEPIDPIEPIEPIKPIEPIEPIKPEEEVDRSASSGAGGLDLASWATGFKKARSARQKSGRSAQGSASQKKNPFKSWAS